MRIIDDKRFSVDCKVEAGPALLTYAAMHTDYSEERVNLETLPDWADDKFWQSIIKNCLQKGGHWGVLEHAQIHFFCHGFPHSVMQQGRTHRHSTWDVQSGRYTGKRLVKTIENQGDIEDVVYLRPVGEYADRFGKGKHVEYNQSMRDEDLSLSRLCLERYTKRFNQGFSPEHCRQVVPFEIRQNFMMSTCLRGFLHFILLRFASDVQPECQTWMHHCIEEARKQLPVLIEWYMEKANKKIRLAP